MNIPSRRDADFNKEEVQKLLEEAKDWTATCPICGEHLIGTIAELKRHKHGE